MTPAEFELIFIGRRVHVVQLDHVVRVVVGHVAAFEFFALARLGLCFGHGAFGAVQVHGAIDLMFGFALGVVKVGVAMVASVLILRMRRHVSFELILFEKTFAATQAKISRLVLAFVVLRRLFGQRNVFG